MLFIEMTYYEKSPELICAVHVFCHFLSDDVMKYAHTQYNKMADSQLEENRR